ncbi:unnamed protein product [Cochlearia groenlandica]
MYPKQFNLHKQPFTMKNKKEQNVESKETNMIREIEREEEEEEKEEKKIDMFFNLIKNYQEARKRRREELTHNSGQRRKKSNSGERSGVVVPAFQPEDFCQNRTELKPLVVNVSDHQKEEKIEVKEEEKANLDLNLAL